MCIKDFQEFYVRSNDRDQVSFIPAFQFRRAELPECSKYFVPDDRQQLKCNKMVAVLFSIMQNPPHHCHHDKYNEHRSRIHPKEYPGARSRKAHPQRLHDRLQKDVHQSVSCQDRKKDGAQIADRPERNGQEHYREKRLHQADELPHDTDAAPSAARLCLCHLHAGSLLIYFSAHAVASFPYCSSSICER